MTIVRLVCRVVVLVCVMASPAQAQGDFQPLELRWPTAVGAAGTGHDADSYLYRAWTGIPWNIRVVVGGGTWQEYTVSLSNAPAGMTMNSTGACTTMPCDNWTINWTNPTTTASNVQVCVSDADEGPDCETWSIAVADCVPGAGGCCVVHADTGSNAAAGTPAAPWQTIAFARSNCGARSVMFLRGGTTADYNFAGITSSNNECYPERVAFVETSQPVIWISYPGDTSAVIDHAGGGVAEPLCVQFTGENVWVDGITFENGDNITLQIVRSNQFGSMVRRSTFRGCGPGSNSFNPGCLMYTTQQPSFSYWDTIQNNTFEDLEYGTGEIAAKLYTITGLIIQDNSVDNVHTRVSEQEGIWATKDSITAFEIRNNSCSDLPAEIPCFGGNVHNTSTTTSGEIHHNLVLASGAVAIHTGVSAGAVWGQFNVYRNTFVGSWTIANLDTADGPVVSERNVIVNAGGNACSTWPDEVACVSVGDYARATFTNDLVGQTADAIVDANGSLQGTYLTDHGPDSPTPKGHVLGETAPPPPIRLRIRKEEIAAALLLPLMVWRRRRHGGRTA
jgi:hypothetical protein